MSEFLSVLPAGVAENVGWIIGFLKAAGIAVIVYALYVIVMGIFTFRRMKKIDEIDKKVDALDKKLDKLLKKK